MEKKRERRSPKTIIRETEKLNVIKNMPPLYHTLPNEKFDIEKSEVVKWLIKQPVILQLIYELVQNRSEQNKLIKYNSKTGKWQGINNNEN